MSLHFAVFYGSVRGERQGIKYARFMNAQLAARGHQVSFVDPLEYGLPLLDKMYKEYPAGAAPDPLPKLADIIRSADGFMIVSGEYNHSIPPALTNLLDHFLEEWFWRPSAIACYSAGAFGGVRAAMQLRATLAELGMPSIPSIHPMPKVQDQFDNDGTPRDPAHVRRVGRFFDEFEWYARALKRARAEGVPILNPSHDLVLLTASIARCRRRHASHCVLRAAQHALTSGMTEARRAARACRERSRGCGVR